jgi:hypothetical protein
MAHAVCGSLSRTLQIVNVCSVWDFYWGKRVVFDKEAVMVLDIALLARCQLNHWMRTPGRVNALLIRESAIQQVGN